MEPYLSLASRKTGSGFKSPTHPALTSAKNSCEPAYNINTHSEVTPPRLSKREAKTLLKQNWQSLEGNTLHVLKESNNREEEPAEMEQAEETKEGPCNLHPCHPIKRRKLSDDKECCYLSDDSNLSVLLRSTFEDTEKIQKSRSEILADRSYSKNSSYGSISNFSLGPNSSRSKVSPKDRKSSDVGNKKESKNQSKSLSSSESIATSMQESISHSTFLSIANSLWAALNGKLLSQEVMSGRGGNDGLSFECCNKHQFIISLSTLSKLEGGIQNKSVCDNWCLKCRNFFRKTEERARKMNSTMLSADMSQGFVRIRCENDHQFIIPYTKNHSKTWCEECKNDDMKQRQEHYKEQEMTEEQRKAQEQKKLFEESYEHMQRQQRSRAGSFASQEEAIYYEQTMKQVCAYAKVKMEKDMSSEDFKGEATHIEIYNVYKVLYMPFDVLVKTLCMIEKSQVSSYYRQLALLLHPDKNKHQLSNEAFKKLGQAYELSKRFI